LKNPNNKTFLEKYGESWFDEREGTYADIIPRFKDFNNGGMILEHILEYEQLLDLNLGSFLSLVKSITNIFSKRTATMMPMTKNDYFNLTEKKPSQQNYSKILADASITKRNVTWIEENGLCLDNIKPGKSTIRQSGYGAFAQRTLLKGTMISPAPLLAIMDKDSMLMYELDYDEEKDQMIRVGNYPIGQQLLVNYCFGHEESSLLLCPQSSMNLINHCSTRIQFEGSSCGKKNGPNAEIKWAEGLDLNTQEWLNMSLEEIGQLVLENKRGLSLQVVATKDIYLNEEIFIDYGLSWEKEWKVHVETWTPPTDEWEDYTPLKRLKEKGLFSQHEYEINKYTENVLLSCFYYTETHENNKENPQEKIKVGEKYISNDINIESNLWPCTIKNRIDDSKYTVSIPFYNVILENYPAESIVFRMNQYTSDQHLPNAFRHFIGINNSIFPKQWRNLPKNW